MSEESSPRTLYVGNLDISVHEELLCTLFSQIGAIQGCKIIREPGNDPYAFLEFKSHQCAATALAAMNKRQFLDKEMKVNWATSPGNQPKLDTSNHHHIFVGDLSPEIETQTLREAFAPFGEISNCRIVRDPQTLKSKGYAFVSFVKKTEAEAAISAMNGQWLGSRSIRTNWSTRKPPPPRSERPRHANNSKQNYEEVYAQSSPTNCTVYCGGFTNGITDDLISKTFSQFGTIQDIRVFKDKGYAFIKFTTKEAATHAIEVTHNTEINGSIVKCFWGKENGDPNSVGPNANQQAQQVTCVAGQYSYGYGQQMYWYPQGYSQMQGQFLQPAQYYSQYYGQQQAQYMNAGMRMQAPGGGTWQPGQATAPPQAGSAPIQPGQQPTMVTYTMPNYPTQ
ncbi:nucleolysin TIAR [Diachasma alloeum]|uniref:nucleolysin TIAR n=1 Tax=Diachasma alloeum TaxID=454923 RepID=UPI00073817A6|nr:nucleolysin TIAR [Diachasma alloeum]